MKKNLLLFFGLSAIVATSTMAAEPVTLLHEDFSGWDGTTLGWMPEGWTVKNSSAELASMFDGRFNWHVSAVDDNTPYPVEGDYLAVIYHANYTEDGTDKKIDLDQDEWLISPKFTPGENGVLSFKLSFYPLFLFDCSNENIDFSGAELEFKNKVKATTMQILAKESALDDWTLLKDIYDDWSEDYSFEDLFNKYYSRDWRGYDLDLGAFAGKEMNIAFRFVGRMGNMMALDAIDITSDKIEPGQGALTSINSGQTATSVTVENGMMTVLNADGASRLTVADMHGRVLMQTSIAAGINIIDISARDTGIVAVVLDNGCVFKVRL